MTTPRTHRQLREALTALSDSYQLLGQERDEAKSTAATHESENRRLRADYAAAQTKLHELGYEISIEQNLAAQQGLIRPAEKWQPKQGIASHLTPGEHESILDQRVAAVTDATRRSTLSAVINALELTDYRRSTSAFSSLLDPRPDRTESDPDRFWADIQTALEVREEKRVTAERERTEEKVAGLRQQAPVTLGFDLALGGLVPGYAVREFRPGDSLLRPSVTFADIVGGSPAKSREHAGKTPAPDMKKPAKKKSENAA